MKSNNDLGFAELTRVGRYSVGEKNGKFRAYGSEWDSNQDASKEMAHHHVCGRGDTATEAIDKMCDAAIVAGRVVAHVHNMQTVLGLSADECETLRAELHEALAELED